ncbi:MAG: phosphotransferase [Chthoniobacterales bacterium]|nr:phosphotransferase [Chthoniobacterales bacterium]
MENRQIEHWLREDGQLTSAPATLTPLGGGVSCEIHVVTQEDRAFVVKRALERLRVAADWRADVSRNTVEYDFYKSLAEPLSGGLPEAYFHNPVRGYFTMEYLGGEWSNWKESLLQGRFDPLHGERAGALLAKLHSATWRDDRLLLRFDTTENFRQLRTDPYLRTTAEKHPAVREMLMAEADRLESSRICLVHGDFSPKNLMIRDHRMVLLDAEVAWFGDPAFDAAFLQAHFFLKGIFHAPHDTLWEIVAESAWEAYCAGLGTLRDQNLEFRCVRLLAILLLARVDGKSPVEYLSPSRQEVVRAFALDALKNLPGSFHAMRTSWRNHLAQQTTL